jgi:hypothetical protein
MLPEGERASAAAFSVSAFAMPAHHDLTFFAANAHDKERWVELIRKKQVELRLVLLKASKKFLVDEVVKNGRKIPVELAIANEVMMKGSKRAGSHGCSLFNPFCPPQLFLTRTILLRLTILPN